jgi:hypothetical protein
MPTESNRETIMEGLAYRGAGTARYLSHPWFEAYRIRTGKPGKKHFDDVSTMIEKTPQILYDLKDNGISRVQQNRGKK